MSAGVLAATISATGAFVVATVTYILTKRAERDAEWRKEKLAYYKEFVASLSGSIAGESTAEGQVRFARASNDLLLFAPYAVIDTLSRFREEIRVPNTAKKIEKHDALLSELFFQIRKDIGIRPSDSRRSFKINLWASGVPPGDGHRGA